MNLALSIGLFFILFALAVEIIITIGLGITHSKLRKVIDRCHQHILEITNERSKGKSQSRSDLGFISDNSGSLLPLVFDNYLLVILRDKIIAYILEDGISSRERTNLITLNVLRCENWLFDFKYDDLQRVMSFIRMLYIPIGSLCAITIFVIGYSSLGADIFNSSYTGISKNIYFIGIMMRNAGLGAAVGLLAYLFSIINSFLIEEKKIEEDLSEAIFQLKATNIILDLE